MSPAAADPALDAPPRPGPIPLALFRRWLDDPAAPTTLTYYVGDLASVRGGVRCDIHGRPRVVIPAPDPAAAAIADAAIAACVARRVVLTQRRLGEARWQYLATKLRTPRHPEDTTR